MSTSSDDTVAGTERVDIFALGHAIVDAEFRVPAQFLTSLGYESGGRYLLEEGPFKILNAALQAPGAGAEWEQQSGGGSAANTLVTAQRLGARCHFSTRVARDPAGWFFTQTLQNDGIVLDASVADAGLSGQCLVLVTPDAERTMVLHLGTTAELQADQIDFTRLDTARVLYLESYLATTASARQSAETALSHARKSAVPRAISLSDPEIVRHHRSTLLSWLESPPELLVGNDAEACALAGLDDPETALDALQGKARLVVITRGGAGCELITEQGRQQIPAPGVTARSSLGAGDTFAGALLYGLYYRGWEPAAAAAFANECAARSVEFSGPRLPREQLQWVLAKSEPSESSMK